VTLKIRTIALKDVSTEEYGLLTRRSAVPDPEIRAGASAIVRDVELNGDAAVREASRLYGGGTDGPIRVPVASISEAAAALPDLLSVAILAAASNVRDVHEQQIQVRTIRETLPGVTVERRWAPIDSVGIHVPGGRAAYPSSAIMGIIPAQIAGVRRICVATPAGPDGTVNPVVLGTAGLLGVDEVYAMGGAQAIGALAYGTESVERVSKIVGPGGPWVTAAKLAVFGVCGIDLPAGPSEAAIVTDADADPVTVAADVMCQAEHGAESAVLLTVPSEDFADEVIDAIQAALPRLPRADTITNALNDNGLIVVCDSLADGLTLANDWAPEHLSIHTESARDDVEAVPNAGSVFVGKWSSEAAGDYATGASHVLPTGGLARSYGPLSVDDFGSYRQIQTLTRSGLEALAPTIFALAGAEGLDAHAYSVMARLEGSP